jgi:hypothetical protein
MSKYRDEFFKDPQFIDLSEPEKQQLWEIMVQETNAELFALVKEDLISMSVDDNGEFVYFMTDEQKERHFKSKQEESDS